MFEARQFIAALSVGLLALVAVGCTDDPAATNNTADNNRVQDPVEPPDNGELLHVDPCVAGQTNCLVELTTTNARDLEVQLIDADGQPVGDALISFEGQLDGSGITLGSANVYTNADGIAKTNIESGVNPGGAGTVTASTSNDMVGALKWTIGVSSKDSSSYRVDFEHNGTSNIKPIDVRLFPPTVSCDDLAPPASIPTADFERQGLVDSAGVFPTVIFPNIANGNAFTVGAWGMSLDHNNEVEVAYGCTDGNEQVVNGNPVDVTVTLVDHIPTITGEYAVTHDFDLTGALPDNVRTIVDLIGRLASDPGSFVVGCPSNDGERSCTSDSQCDSGDMCADNGRCTDRACPAGTPGVAQLILDFLPSNIRDSVESFLDSSFGNAVARDLINDAFDSWLNSGNAPSWFSDTINITADVYDTLRRFRVTGIIRISDAPEVAIDEATGQVVGVLPEDAGYQLWDSFIFYWSQGCENAPNPEFCAQRQPLSAADLGIEAVAGTFSGTIYDSDKLQINQHTLSLNYGALLVAVIERFVLPAVFGNSCGDSDNLACDSLELALQEMISCAQVAEFAGDEGSSLYNIAKNGCEGLLTQASDRLRDYAAQNLVAEGGDVFLIATPSDAHCTISQPEQYVADWHTDPLPYIQHLGKDSADMKCKWDVQIKFSDNFTAEVDGSFWGDRTAFAND